MATTSQIAQNDRWDDRPPPAQPQETPILEAPEDFGSLRQGREPTTCLHLPPLDSPIEVFWVTSEQLALLRKGSTAASDSLALFALFLGCFVSLFPLWLVSVFTGNLSIWLSRALLDTSIMTGLFALLKFVQWMRSRKEWKDLVQTVTARQGYPNQPSRLDS